MWLWANYAPQWRTRASPASFIACCLARPMRTSVCKTRWLHGRLWQNVGVFIYMHTNFDTSRKNHNVRLIRKCAGFWRVLLRYMCTASLILSETMYWVLLNIILKNYSSGATYTTSMAQWIVRKQCSIWAKISSRRFLTGFPLIGVNWSLFMLKTIVQTTMTCRHIVRSKPDQLPTQSTYGFHIRVCMKTRRRLPERLISASVPVSSRKSILSGLKMRSFDNSGVLCIDTSPYQNLVFMHLDRAMHYCTYAAE